MNEDGELVPDNDIVDDTNPPKAAQPAGKKQPDPVPYARFQEVVVQRRNLEGKLSEAETALTNAETAKLAAETKLAEAQAAVTAAGVAADAKVAESTTLLDKYKEVVSSTVNEMTTDWPDEAKMFDPGADADPLVRLEWAQKAKLLVAKLQPAGTPPGAAPKPTPKQPAQPNQEVKSSVDVKRRF